MNRKNTVIILTVAIILGLVTFFAVMRYIQKVKQTVEKESREVVVAATPLKARTTIQPGMLVLKPIPNSMVAPKAIFHIEQALGKVTLAPYKQDEQIQENDLTTKDKVPGLSFIIPEGKRAVTLRVDDVKGVGSSVHPGDRVDILATYRDPVTGQQLTQIILQRMEVLAIDDVQMDTAKGGKGASKSVTLAVTPEEAQKLTVTDSEGALRMMLRPEDDKTVVDLKAVRLRDLVRPTAVPDDSALLQPPAKQMLIGEKEPPKVKMFRGSEAPRDIPVGE